MKKINVERQDIKDWLKTADSASRGEHYKGLWRKVYKLSAVPSRARPGVNLYKLNKYTQEGDNVIVPGKVLSEGAMDHKINITAMEFSGKAKDMLKSSSCNIKTIMEMTKLEKIKIII